MTSLAVPIRSAERLVSFGGICGLIGVVCDLMTPVGNYTIWALIGGGVILGFGLMLAIWRGLADQIAQSFAAFGGLLLVISVCFMAFAPEGDRGVLATEFDWVANVQNDLFDIKEATVQIASNTAEIADNTKDIATDTELVRRLSFSMDGFLNALDSYDQANIRAYCDNGYRIYQVGFLLPPFRDHKLNEASFKLLSELKCFDTELICDTADWPGAQFDPRRVATVCGAAGLRHLEQRETERKAWELAAAQKREKCREEAKSDPLYQHWPDTVLLRCG